MKKIKQFSLTLFVGIFAVIALLECSDDAPKVGGGGGEEPYVCPKAQPITETPANKAALVTLVNAAITTENPSPDLNHINVSNVTDMRELFKGKGTFNGDISCWETGQVITMYAMFNAAEAFNGDISKWDTRGVTTMEYMFSGAIAFNRNIATDGNYWNTSTVTDMSSMFDGATVFNQDLTSWDISSLISLGKANFADDSGFATDMTKHPKWCSNPANNRHRNCSP